MTQFLHTYYHSLFCISGGWNKISHSKSFAFFLRLCTLLLLYVCSTFFLSSQIVASYTYLLCDGLAIGDSMNRLGNILDIRIVQSGNADSSIGGQIDSVFICQAMAHLGVHSCKRKHSNLTGDMRPVMFALGHIDQVVD